MGRDLWQGAGTERGLGCGRGGRGEWRWGVEGRQDIGRALIRGDGRIGYYYSKI